jgi:glucose 1-dehydrogenase (FAD, quinone)
LDWKFQTEKSDNYCLAMNNGRCNWPRGRVLGGCSTINAMLYVRGNRKDYDEWEELGNPGKLTTVDIHISAHPLL